jgi:hypothetical protein
LESFARSTENIFGELLSAFAHTSPKLGEPFRVHPCGFKTGASKLSQTAGNRRQPTDECARGRTNNLTPDLRLGGLNPRSGDGLKLTPKSRSSVTGSRRCLKEACTKVGR